MGADRFAWYALGRSCSMSTQIRRYAVAAFAVVGMIVVAASQRQSEMPRHLFRITFGLQDKKSTDWSGKVEISGGEVVAIDGWRFEEKDAVEGTRGWKCRTHERIAPGERFPLEDAEGKVKPVPKTPWPNGVTLTVRGEAPALTVALPTGEIRFKSEEILLGESKTFLDGQVRVERLPDTSVLRPAAGPKAAYPVQDDYPAFWVRYKTGKQYLAWVAYRQEKDRVLFSERDGSEGVWSEPKEVAGAGDHFRVALASTHGNTLWIVWASQRQQNWDLFARPYQDGKLGEEIRLTDHAGPDIWHTMTTDQRGRAWLVWQGFRDGQADVFARCVDGDGWHDAIRVSTSRANDWNPVVTSDPKTDRIWVAWDSYDSGEYGIRVRSLSGGPSPKLGEILCPDKSPVFQAHPSLACDRAGRLWVAWDQSGPQWGKDTGHQVTENAGTRLYHDRSLRVACLVDDKWQEPEADLVKALPSELRTFSELPCLQGDTEGRMWLAFRHRTTLVPRADDWAARGRWDVYATAFLGDRWTSPVALPQSAGRNDMRMSPQRDPKGSVYFAYASDNRGWFPPGALMERNLSVAVSRLHGAGNVAEPRWRDVRIASREVKRIHPREAEQVKRIRAYKIESGGRTYRIYRGDMHRHTDISPDGVGDGSLMDLHRYALDAAAFDFIFVTDHNMGSDKEYPWWRTQKANDLYTVPQAFISMYGYERSVPYPNGHRNILWTERGHRTLPLPRPGIPKQMADDTGKVYDYLRRTGGICTLHTSATDQGTNWNEHDNALEPVVELFQGFDSSYEAPGAPRSIDDKADRVHGPYRKDGYVSLALAKGYRLGFQASSDHVSTHISYACILAEEFSRKGLIEALKKRHSYAATDNIVLDVRMGANMMGDEVRIGKPSLDVVVLGTSPLDRVEVLRDGEVVHTHRPEKGGEEAKFHWEDAQPKKDGRVSYYYVRVVQKDRQMAWSSPIWVRPAE
jgi:hypothetical protein